MANDHVNINYVDVKESECMIVRWIIVVIKDDGWEPDHVDNLHTNYIQVPLNVGMYIFVLRSHGKYIGYIIIASQNNFYLEYTDK